MSALESEGPRKNRSTIFFVFLAVVVVLAGAAYFLRPRFEGDAPQVSIVPDSGVLGLAPIEIAVTDPGAGLKSVTATLAASGAEYTLASEQFSQPVPEKRISVALSSKLAGVKEGPAVLRVAARDASLSHFFRGNETVIEKKVTIDITPPSIELVADDRYVNFGGVGVIVYKPSADTEKSGIKIGDYFFPGYPGQIKSHPDYWLGLFAHPYNVPENVKAVLVAPLLNDVAARQGTPKEIFVRVNKGLRIENETKIAEITSKSTPSILWRGAFKQLSNSKVEANFADERTYTYNGEPVDTAYHLGYDLSVTKHYPIEAANSGKVAFVGDLGIYGNVVILDHGLGLFTLYGHMSSFDVKVGDSVTQGQILGKTGETGLAAGDHLHYGVYLHGVAVLPVEWWDAKWINDNITPKLEGKGGDEIAEAQQVRAPRAKTLRAKAPRKVAHRRHR